MNITYSTNAWGTIYAHGGATNNVNSAFYVTDGDVDRAFSDIAAAGFASAEMFDGDLLPYETCPDVLAAKLKQHALTLKGVYSAACFIYDEILDEEISRILRTLDIARKLGADQLVLGGGAIRYTGRQEADFEKLGAALDRVSELAAGLGVTASYHPHMGSLVETPEQLDKVMRHSRIALCPDCGHVRLGGGDPYTVAKKYIDRIRYFHLKGVDGDGRFCAIDKGVFDSRPIMELMMQHPDIELAVEADGSQTAPEKDAMDSARFLSAFVKE